MTFDPARIRPLIDVTWPPAAMTRLGPWVLRDGAGGGKRVSAATTEQDDASGDDIEAAAKAMDDGGCQAIFAVAPHQGALDHRLAERAYLLLDPTRLYHCPVDGLTERAPTIPGGIACWPPAQIQRDIWDAGGVGPARQAVMERVTAPRSALLWRDRDEPAATTFLAIHDGVAMLHAFEVRHDLRRGGNGSALMRHAALWAAGKGAETLALLVTEANAPANAFYRSLGMASQRAYHYRVRP